MSLRHAVMDTPVGVLTLVESDRGLRGLYMEQTKRPLTPAIIGPRDDAVAGETRRQLREYFVGRRREFDLPLDLRGTGFQLAVWEQLLRIPYGQRRSYGQIAADLGDPRSVRAVGAANGSNPVSIIVPCHRVVAGTGALTGYAGGVERKRYLLELETRVMGGTPTLM
ncbi:methylated-DNA--[protein]-cysteine S-methyltransferase [Blastococcus sp. Marseille-P5729]|uniref:methylated-DNA--[protein]-cysteine S-methyltransferase n=1 Tax=Blastococcus sp. Marseille-P5729 TaxID=2086582 RepID=UPI000D0E53BB|nr:methylated-DNA--[protein]-cysteine S-methyltransferase [Blastococcus sp. Marseille-P5729]